MRIGVDASILHPMTRYSGIGRYLFELACRFPDAEPGNEYIFFAPHGHDRPDALPREIAWQPLPVPRLGKFSMLATYLWVLPREARRLGLDVFHAPAVHPRPSWPPAPRRLPCPLVLTIHDLIPLTFYSSGPDRLPRHHRMFYRWNLRAAREAARVITVSHASRDELVRMLDLPSRKIVAIPNGVRYVAEQGPRRAEARRYILFVGSYEARKNLASAVRAFALVARRLPDHDLLVVASPGSGDVRSVQDFIARSGLTNRVRVAAAVSDRELAALYANADLFVFPSFAEGFGLPPLEAMASGVPVIASNLPAHHEVLGDAALLVAPRDHHAIAEAMGRVLQDDVLRARLTERGLERARRYTWKDATRKTLDVYHAAAGYVDEAALPKEIMAGTRDAVH